VKPQQDSRGSRIEAHQVSDLLSRDENGSMSRGKELMIRGNARPQGAVASEPAGKSSAAGDPTEGSSEGSNEGYAK
jgi:hypothetical protein